MSNLLEILKLEPQDTDQLEGVKLKRLTTLSVGESVNGTTTLERSVTVSLKVEHFHKIQWFHSFFKIYFFY